MIHYKNLIGGMSLTSDAEAIEAINRPKQNNVQGPRQANVQGRKFSLSPSVNMRRIALHVSKHFLRIAKKETKYNQSIDTAKIKEINELSLKLA